MFGERVAMAAGVRALGHGCSENEPAGICLLCLSPMQSAGCEGGLQDQL